MLVVTISFYGAGVNYGWGKVVKCQKCERERMIFNTLPPQMNIEAGDEIEGEVVLNFIGKCESNTGLHFWKICDDFEKFLLPAGYISWGLPFLFSSITAVPEEISKLYRKKYYCREICSFTTEHPFRHVINLNYKSLTRMEPEIEVMCPSCFREMTEPLQGNLRGKLLNMLEIKPRLKNQHQPGVICYKDQAELFGHIIKIIKGPGSIMVRPPEAVVTSHSCKEIVIVSIEHPEHGYLDIEIPNASHYLYLYHPWPQRGWD